MEHGLDFGCGSSYGSGTVNGEGEQIPGGIQNPHPFDGLAWKTALGALLAQVPAVLDQSTAHRTDLNRRHLRKELVEGNDTVPRLTQLASP